LGQVKGGYDHLTQQEEADDHQPEAAADRRAGAAGPADEVQHAVDDDGEDGDLHKVARAERFIQLRQSMDHDTPRSAPASGGGGPPRRGGRPPPPSPPPTLSPPPPPRHSSTAASSVTASRVSSTSWTRTTWTAPRATA